MPRRGPDTQDAQVEGQIKPIDEREKEIESARKRKTKIGEKERERTRQTNRQTDRPDEGLEGSTLGVDAQRDSFALLVLSDEAVDQLWSGDRK